MTKRTKRYGGFRIGDRVRVKKKADAVYWDFECMMEGTVVSKIKGYLNIEFIDKNGGKHYFGRYPYQLINLTRIKEERESDIEERLKRMGMENWKPKDHDIMPPSQEELKVIKDFVDEALRQTEIFLSHLSPCGDPLPSPYTRDVYCCTLNY